MRIFVLEDEAILLNGTVSAISQVRPKAQIFPFSRPKEALEAVAEGNHPDVVFSDIRMPGLNGLEFAVKLRTLCPKAKVIFVTGYEQYAVDAFRIHAHGYIMKPLTPDRIREELDYLEHPEKKPISNQLVVRCFGHFEVYWQGEPLLFSRRQTKELLAILVDREGAVCTAEEISTALWENEGDLRLTKNRIRVLVSDLRNTLNKIGQGDVLIRRSGELSVRKDLLYCDYYRMLAGDPDAINEFYGQYMQQYSWAELTAGRIFFRVAE